VLRGRLGCDFSGVDLITLKTVSKVADNARNAAAAETETG
jgi:hypothetical protein